MKKLVLRARISELDGLSDALVRKYKADSTAGNNSFIKETMEEIESLSARITTATLQDKVHSPLADADKERDNALKSFGKMLSAYSLLRDGKKSGAAAALKAVYDKYAKAGITTTSYLRESALIESLLEDVADESLAPNIAELDGVELAIGAIRTAQEAFNKASDDYVEAVNGKSESASSYRAPLVKAINEKLVPYLTAMSIEGNSDCVSFADSVENEINRLNATITARSGKKTQNPGKSEPEQPSQGNE